jgi:GAF domain-containing protein/HAMP domain-containing protein
MNTSSLDQIIQLVTWFVALVEFTMAAYILLLNRWRTSNQHFSALFVLLAINNLAISQMIGAVDISFARFPSYLLAATSPLIQPALFLLTIVLLKPDWLEGKRRAIWLPAYILAALPIALTLIDLTFGTGLWYTGIDPATYAGGYISVFEFVEGSLAPVLQIVLFYFMSVVPLVLLAYIIFIDKKTTEENRNVAWILAITLIIATVVQMGLRDSVAPEIRTVITATVLAFSYGYSSIRVMMREQWGQRGRLQPRITGLILATTVPIIVAVAIFGTTRASTALEQEANDRLSVTNHSLSSNTSVWLDFNIKALQNLVVLPEVTGMDADQQRPALQAMDQTYEHMYLVSVTDLEGRNVSRSDNAAPKDYGDRLWFQEIRNGASLAFQTLIGRTSGTPALVISAPIYDRDDDLIGVGMFASDLTNVAQEVEPIRIGETGYSYILDNENRVVLHSDPIYYEDLRDLSTYPPVVALRQGNRGIVEFTDEAGDTWRAYVDVMENGWGVVVQQQEAELLSALSLFQRLAWTATIVGTVMLSILTSLTIRQAFRPIGQLTHTATAITAGDYTKTAPVTTEDELGTLARAFNEMTAQLHGAIDELEQRVAERTEDLEQQTTMLSAAAEVTRDTTTVRDLETMLRRAVTQIQNAFGFYHVGIFLLDDLGEFAVLQAATGQAGRQMLANEHRLRVGHRGIVGYVTLTGQPRLARDVAADAMHFKHPLLPDTRSEMALPLRIGRQIIGAIDIQSREVDAFEESDVAVLQTMADQLAVAIENARLLAKTQQAVRELELAYGKHTLEAWQTLKQGADRQIGYRYRRLGVEPAGEPATEAQQAWTAGQAVTITSSKPEDDEKFAISTAAIPIRFRDQVIGVLNIRSKDGNLAPETVELVEEVANRLGMALENARLLEATRQQAIREQTLSQVTASIRTESEIDLILERALEELGRVLEAERAVAHLNPVERREG